MGMKLKSGADLCGFELSRFCVQNDVAIPDAPASGRKYFHTGTGMEGKYSLLGRERIFTGTSWRAAAYVDDLANLDLATNADYLALKERVDAFLDGEVDSNGVLDNLKEIQKFLDNYSSATDLTDILDTKLDKKGGIISSSNGVPLTINSIAGYTGLVLQINGANKSVFGADGYWGTYMGIADTNCKLGIFPDSTPFFHDGTTHTLLHSGNVGKYEAGSAKILSDYAGRIQSANLNSFADSGLRKFIASTSMTEGKPPYDGSILHFAWDNNMGFDQQLFLANSSQVQVNERMAWRAQHAGVWGDWKTIAFTDSTVEAARKLETASGILEGFSLYSTPAVYGIKLVNGDSSSRFGFYSYETGKYAGIVNTKNDIENCGLQLHDNGNVYVFGKNFGLGIANPQHKLDVAGTMNVSDSAYFQSVPYMKSHLLMDSEGGYIRLGHGYEGIYITKDSINWHTTSGGWMASLVGFTSSSLLLKQNTDINGNVVASGTIACKGVAAEGSAPVGTVDKWAGSIATGTKSQTYTHGLGTTDITVAIYEKNGNEWVQILTDVDIVNANTIRVTFGANTTVEHRIVVMG